ncbi:putative flagellar associated protein [Monocercomonoides exilis]|uniref:putative flagellar associated protein n=1 Tax=Monocercomonoides exilis TaxID=2049356 RepID=UPI003559AD6F|nr:putative flagellar associated protein [Monocercomonoides exilis]|eukprot:MONOS_2763.1-p1 / transcript=MONOS_2763.1 / gene=MONOS_2763 / organism=Monocercomonoides_exilis_PA203 / gene_product=flagellar associated protein / transcript_product=flagellar associated protein / location=Mono_scaffold00059:36458-38415(+) / protein_length=486 / sequence_SO=supercontig / SO=protein_coding / is_pseudo=false
MAQTIQRFHPNAKPSGFIPSLSELCAICIGENLDKVLAESTIPIPQWLLPLDEFGEKVPPEAEKQFISHFFLSPQSCWTRHFPIFIKSIPTDLDLSIAALALDDDRYWKARCEATWTVTDCPKTLRYKNYYFERFISECIEQYADPFQKRNLLSQLSSEKHNHTLVSSSSNSKSLSKKICEKQDLKPFHTKIVGQSEAGSQAILDDMLMLIMLFDIGAPFVSSLHIKQLPSHLHPILLITHLTNLISLSVRYSPLSSGMTYSASDSEEGPTATDCQRWREALPQSHLTSLCLSNNSLQNKHVKILSFGLLENRTITQLDISHNELSYDALNSLSQCLHPKSNPILSVLNLENNKFGSDCGNLFGLILAHNKSLTVLNLKLNALKDEGILAMCRGLTENTTLTSLNISSNEITVASIATLLQALRNHPTLRSLDISCNDLHGAPKKLFVEALNGDVLRMIDVRNTHLSASDEEEILSIGREKMKEVG